MLVIPTVRLGWTGDIQVFAPTANFLFDTSGMLGCWLQDLAEEQLKDLGGIPQVVVPDVLTGTWFPHVRCTFGARRRHCVLIPKSMELFE
jgi:hypothetical protein